MIIKLGRCQEDAVTMHLPDTFWVASQNQEEEVRKEEERGRIQLSADENGSCWMGPQGAAEPSPQVPAPMRPSRAGQHCAE